MIAAADFNITRVETSKLQDINLENIPFGRYFTDHMLEVDYEDGEWKTPRSNLISHCCWPLPLRPCIMAAAIFEGIKAYKNLNNEAYIFRPIDNFRRFNVSAERMQMPQVPEEIFMGGMRLLIELDKAGSPISPIIRCIYAPYVQQ